MSPTVPANAAPLHRPGFLCLPLAIIRLSPKISSKGSPVAGNAGTVLSRAGSRTIFPEFSTSRWENVIRVAEQAVHHIASGGSGVAPRAPKRQFNAFLQAFFEHPEREPKESDGVPRKSVRQQPGEIFVASTRGFPRCPPGAPGHPVAASPARAVGHLIRPTR